MAMTKRVAAERNITAADIEAAENLRRLWLAAVGKAQDQGRRLTQKEAAAVLGWSASMVSHYLQCLTPLGPVAVLKWAAYLNCKTTDIRPDFKFAGIAPGELSQEGTEIAVRWEALPPRLRESVRALILDNSPK